MQIEGAFGRIYHTLVGLNVSFSMAIHFQNAHKMRDFQYPLSTENRMLYNKERHSLLMKCFKPFLRYMRQVKEAPDSVVMSFMGLDVPFLTPVNSQIGHKLPESSYPLSMANGMMYHNERHPLFMKCLKSSI